MIINHKYKFIFLKTRKTAGTSVAIALSQFCGEGDTLAPIHGEDEVKRYELTTLNPQNYYVATEFYTPVDHVRALFNHKKRFKNHTGAKFVRNNISEEIWNSYFKFSIERNPYDKAISRYYWSNRNNDKLPPISEFLDRVKTKLLSNWEIYTIDDQLAVDFVCRYENLAEDLAHVQEKLNLSGSLELPRTKAKTRKNRDHYSKVLDDHARARIEKVCASEIAAFGYIWEEPDNDKPPVE